MKKIVMIIMLGAGITLHAQNKTEQTKTTTVTVDNGTGKPRKLTKIEKTQANQDIEFEKTKKDNLNKDIKQTPVKVTKSTTIETDGIPAYYEMNGEKFQFLAEKTGYKVSTTNNDSYGIIRKTPNGQYIYRSNDRTSVGTFDEEGNFIIETYDDKSGNVIVETYTKIN